jgi:predicted RNA-binding protein with PUA-like domain
MADLKETKTEAWDGIRNYQARNFVRDGVAVGDLALFCHAR